MGHESLHEVKAFLLLNRQKIEGRRQAVVLLGEGKSASEIVTLMESRDLFKDVPLPESRGVFSAEKEIELCAQKGISFLLYSDPDYPALLKEIADPPLVLYKRGIFAETDRHAVAIVGTRHPSFYGRLQAKKFSLELAAKGLTIVSGLARGIDQIAHEAALQVSYGRTVAVMGCGLDVIYPKEHEGLLRRIAERGVVLSEYPLGTPPLPENFPRRNRILSGLSYATLVVEAHSRSGSLITAHQAVEQGREVFALPGPVDQLTSRGTHQLIKEGAYLVETPEDVLLVLEDRLRLENKFDLKDVGRASPVGGEESQEKKGTFLIALGHSLKAWALPRSRLGELGSPEVAPREALLSTEKEIPKKTFSLGPVEEEARIVEELLREEGALAQDEILESTGLEPGKLPGLLLQLELTKKLRKSPDGRYSLFS